VIELTDIIKRHNLKADKHFLKYLKLNISSYRHGALHVL
jgi:hypothetical protein